MRRLLDVLAIGFVVGSIALQGAFLTAIGGLPGPAPALAAGAPASPPAAVAAKGCVETADRKC